MSKYQDDLKEAQRQVNKREFLILGLLVLLFISIAGTLYAMKTIKVQVDPGLSSTKKYQRGETDEAYVYAFTNGLIQSLFTWKDDGQTDYEQNIENLKNFMTPGCYESVQDDLKFRSTHGELRKRVRLMVPIQFASGHEQVKHDPPSKWMVRVQYDMEESVRGVTIKKGRYYWDVPVIRDSSKKHLNRFELSIDCPFANNTPVLVKEYEK